MLDSEASMSLRCQGFLSVATLPHSDVSGRLRTAVSIRALGFLSAVGVLDSRSLSPTLWILKAELCRAND